MGPAGHITEEAVQRRDVGEHQSSGLDWWVSACLLPTCEFIYLFDRYVGCYPMSYSKLHLDSFIALIPIECNLPDTISCLSCYWIFTHSKIVSSVFEWVSHYIYLFIFNYYYFAAGTVVRPDHSIKNNRHVVFHVEPTLFWLYLLDFGGYSSQTLWNLRFLTEKKYWRFCGLSLNLGMGVSNDRGP